MNKEARQLLIVTFLLLAVAITSFVATSYSTPSEIRIIAIIITAILIAATAITHYVFKKRG